MLYRYVTVCGHGISYIVTNVYLLKVKKVAISRMSAGSWFQACGAATGNDLNEKAVRERGMSKWPCSAERRCDLPGSC